jgi:LemA protein
MRQLTRNAWSDVDVYLKRRAELVPNLVSAVKGYAQHEQATLEQTVQARNQALAAPSLAARADAEQQVASGVTRVMLLAESYPQLKASENFLELQRSLSETEKLIASARQYYNACVRDYNTLIEAFPSSIAAGAFGFKPAEFFELESASERDVPRLEGLP